MKEFQQSTLFSWERTVNGKSLHKLGYQIGAKRKFDEIDLPDRDISLYSDDLSLEKEFYTKISDCVLTIIKQEFESRSLEYKPIRNNFHSKFCPPKSSSPSSSSSTLYESEEDIPEVVISINSSPRVSVVPDWR